MFAACRPQARLSSARPLAPCVVNECDGFSRGTEALSVYKDLVAGNAADAVQSREAAVLKADVVTAAFARASRVAPTVQFVRKAATFEFMQRLMLSSTCVHTR